MAGGVLPFGLGKGVRGLQDMLSVPLCLSSGFPLETIPKFV